MTLSAESPMTLCCPSCNKLLSDLRIIFHTAHPPTVPLSKDSQFLSFNQALSPHLSSNTRVITVGVYHVYDTNSPLLL